MAAGDLAPVSEASRLSRPMMSESLDMLREMIRMLLVMPD